MDRRKAIASFTGIWDPQDAMAARDGARARTGSTSASELDQRRERRMAFVARKQRARGLNVARCRQGTPRGAGSVSAAGLPPSQCVPNAVSLSASSRAGAARPPTKRGIPRGIGWPHGCRYTAARTR